MRFGLVKYLNALPFYTSLNTNDLQLTLGHPTELNYLLEQDKLDVALTSSVHSFEKNYRILPYCIASDGPVMSVNLYLQKELKNSRILLPYASATSIALLKILCFHFWKVEPLFVTQGQEYDGQLIIGDAALAQYESSFQCIDLGQAWKEETGLPFVFALMMAQEEIETNSLENALNKALEWARAHQQILLERACQLSNLPYWLLANYYSKLLYRLEEKELQGLKLFRELHKTLYVPTVTA